jgi:hypothetical protein
MLVIHISATKLFFPKKRNSDSIIIVWIQMSGNIDSWCTALENRPFFVFLMCNLIVMGPYSLLLSGTLVDTRYTSSCFLIHWLLLYHIGVLAKDEGCLMLSSNPDCLGDYCWRKLVSCDSKTSILIKCYSIFWIASNVTPKLNYLAFCLI